VPSALAASDLNRGLQILGACLLSLSAGAQATLPSPTHLRVLRVRTGPSTKRQHSLLQTRKIFDEASVQLSWGPVEGASWYVVRTSTTHDFVKNLTFRVKAPTCVDAEGWHDAHGSWFDCTWYHHWTRCESQGTSGANDKCCSCGGGNLVVRNASFELNQTAPTQFTVPGLIAGQEIFISVASIHASAQEAWALSADGPEWNAAIAVIPLDAVTNPVGRIAWGTYNDSHAHLLWADSSSGPAATDYLVSWQENEGGLLQEPKYTTTVRGAPALISPVVRGARYDVTIKSRNLNHDPNDPWANAQSTTKQRLEVFAPPQSVIGLTAAASESRIDLSWEDTRRGCDGAARAQCDEELRFRVEIAEGAGADTGVYSLLVDELSAFAYTVTGLSTGKYYSLRVSARNFHTQGYSAADTVEAQTAPLPAPPHIEVTEVSPFTGKLQWTVPGSEDKQLSFDIRECHPNSNPPCFDATSGLPNEASFIAPPSGATCCTDQSFGPYSKLMVGFQLVGEEYVVRIRARNANGHGEWSYVAVRPLDEPSSPAWAEASLANTLDLHANLSSSAAEAAMWAASSVLLRWDPARFADRYYIKVSENGGAFLPHDQVVPVCTGEWPWYARALSPESLTVDAGNLPLDRDLACRPFTPAVCSPWREVCDSQDGSRALVYGLRPGANYSFQVFAGNLYKIKAAGASTQVIRLPEVPAVASSVGGLRVAFVTETTVGLEWHGLNSSDEVVAYQVQAVDPVDASIKQTREVRHLSGSASGHRVHSITLSGLIQDAMLDMIVRARSLHASGYQESPTAYLRVAPSPPPRGRVAGLRAVSVTENSVMLSWSYVGSDLVTRYKVEGSSSNFTEHLPSPEALDLNGNVYITEDEFVRYAFLDARFVEFDYNSDDKWSQNEFDQWSRDLGGYKSFDGADADVDGYLSHPEFQDLGAAATGAAAAAGGGESADAANNLKAKFMHFDSDRDGTWMPEEYGAFALAFAPSVVVDVEIDAAFQLERGIEVFNVTGLQKGRHYLFRVSAGNLHASDFDESVAASSTGVIPVSLPSAVSDLKVVALGASVVTLSWTDPPGAPPTFYQVRLSVKNRGYTNVYDAKTLPTVVAAGESNLLNGRPAARSRDGATAGGALNTVSVTNLDRGARHRFRVHARNLNEQGYETLGSNVVEVYLQMQPPPASNIRLLETTDTSVVIGWEAESFPRIKEFLIRWWTSGSVGVGPPREMSVLEGERTANVSGLEAGKQVAIAVLPRNWNTLAPEELQGAATIIAEAASVPGVVQTLEAIAVSSTSVTLQFHESDLGSATRYIVEIKRADQARWREYTKVSCRELSHEPVECSTTIIVDGLTQGVAYDMVVLLLNQNADPPLRPTPLRVTPVNIPSLAVTDLRVTSLTTSSVTVAFKIPAGVDAPFAFKVIWSCDGFQSEQMSEEVTSTEYTIAGLKLNRRCEATVMGRNLNSLGYTGATRALPIAIVASDVPSEPQAVESVSATVSSVTIEWQPPLLGNPVVQYRIEVANETQSEVPIFYVAGYTSGTTRRFKVASQTSIPHEPFTLYQVLDSCRRFCTGPAGRRLPQLVPRV